MIVGTTEGVCSYKGQSRVMELVLGFDSSPCTYACVFSCTCIHTHLGVLRLVSVKYTAAARGVAADEPLGLS